MTKESKKPVLELVNSAKKPPPKKPSKTDGGGGNSGGGKGANSPDQFGDYKVINGAFYQIKVVKDGEGGYKNVDFPLCDFTCRIIEEITADDGLTDSSFLRVEGKRSDGLPLPWWMFRPRRFIPRKATGQTSIGGRCRSFIPALPRRTTYAPPSTNIPA